MKTTLNRSAQALTCVAALLLSACGGGGNAVVDAVMPPVALSGVVADGLIAGATVCYDLNDNGRCDTGEPSTVTITDGSYSLSIPFTAAGTHATIAQVPATAINVETGAPFGQAFTLQSPFQSDTSQPVYVTPLTTAVAEVMAASGNTDKEAAKAAAVTQVTQTLGLGISPLANFVAAQTSSDPAVAAAAASASTFAQVLTEIRVNVAAVAAAAPTPPTPAEVAALASSASMNALTTLAGTVSTSAGQTPTQIAASTVTAQGITPTTVATQATIAVTIASAPVEVAAPTAANTPTVSLRDFRYTDANNWSYRVFTGDGVVDNGFKYLNDVRVIKTNSQMKDYNRNASYFDTASNTWYECPSDGYRAIKYTDPVGTTPGTSLYCHTYAATTRRTVEDITGQTFASVVDRIRNSGLPDAANWAGSSTQMTNPGGTFPANSKLTYIVGTDTSVPDVHSLSSKVKVLPKGETSSSSMAFANWPFALDLNDMVKRYYGEFQSEYPLVPLGNINGNILLTLADVPDPTANTTLYQPHASYRVAFNPAAATQTGGALRYYKCRRAVTTGYTRACEVLSDSTYSIETKGDARVLRLANIPAPAVAFKKFKQLFVERGGAVFWGSTAITQTITTARLNSEAWSALRPQFAGVTTHTDPVAPVALDAASWLRDIRDNTNGFSYRINFSNGITSGTGGEIRATYICPNGNCSPLPNPEIYARNRMYLIGGVWKDADADQACVSSGVALSTWTSSPRQSVACGGVDGATSFDVDISGNTLASVFDEGRKYSGRAYGGNNSNWGGNPLDANNIATIMPPGSKLRYMTGTSISTPYTFGLAVSDKLIIASADASDIGQITQYYGVANGPNGGTITLGLYTINGVNSPTATTTGQLRVRVAFSGTNTANFYLCDVASAGGASMNCALDGTGSYAVTSMGGKVVATFSYTTNILNILKEFKQGERTLVAHDGKVYYGNKDFEGLKHYTLRLNQTAYQAMFASFGITPLTATPVAP